MDTFGLMRKHISDLVLGSVVNHLQTVVVVEAEMGWLYIPVNSEPQTG